MKRSKPLRRTTTPIARKTPIDRTKPPKAATVARRKAKAAADRKAAKTRTRVREETLADWQGVCACRAPGCFVVQAVRLHVHEEPPRSQGGDPLDPLDCLLLSPRCHQRRTGELGGGQSLRIRVTDPVLRCRGVIKFHDRFTGAIWWTVPHTLEQYGTLKGAQQA